jgi:hypothetical protein
VQGETLSRFLPGKSEEFPFGVAARHREHPD